MKPHEVCVSEKIRDLAESKGKWVQGLFVFQDKQKRSGHSNV